MRSSIKRLFSHWHLDNIKVVRRVIVSVVGATVVLIGIALLFYPGRRSCYPWARDSRHGVRVGAPVAQKVRRIASDVVSGRKRTSIRDLVSSIIAASTRNAQPAVPNANCQAWKQS